MKSGLALVVFCVSAAVATTALGADRRSKPKPLPKTIPKTVIGDVFRKHIESLRTCASQQLIQDPRVTGTVLLSLKIGGYGKVRDVKLLSKEHEGTFVHKCAIQVFRRMKFPKFSGDPISVPRIPLRLIKQKTKCKPYVFSIQDLCAPDSGNENHDVENKPVTPCEYIHPISSSDILGMMRSRISEFKECLRVHMNKESPVTGRMSVKFLINPSGRVSKVRITTPTFRDTIVGNCISKIIRQLKFPKYKGAPKEVDFPFSVK